MDLRIYIFKNYEPKENVYISNPYCVSEIKLFIDFHFKSKKQSI